MEQIRAVAGRRPAPPRAAAGIRWAMLLIVLVVLGLLIVGAWYLFTVRGAFGGGREAERPAPYPYTGPQPARP